jgi:acetyl-CoA carboxylase biotin carboxyl carrier protein
MDLRKLKTLIDLVSESGISELEVNEGEDRVRIVNSGSTAHTGQAVYTNPAPTQAAQIAPAPSASVPVAVAAPEEPSETGFVARSPMVGTFYRAPNPESPNFVLHAPLRRIRDLLRTGPEHESSHSGVKSPGLTPQHVCNTFSSA